MDFTIKFYTFWSVGKSFKNSKNLKKEAVKNEIKKQCQNAQSAPAACARNCVKTRKNHVFFKAVKN
jgi:hypothetical protein